MTALGPPALRLDRGAAELRPEQRVRRVHRGRRRLEGGQAMIETAIVALFAVLLLVGVYAVTVALGDAGDIGLASRAGARYAAQVGDANYTTATPAACQGGVTTNPCAVDQQVLQNVLQSLAPNGSTNGVPSQPSGSGPIPSLRFATITKIVIYEPCGGGCGVSCAGGSPPNSPYNPATDKAEEFTPSGATWTEANNGANGAYTLDLRKQLHPNEGVVGVEVFYSYQSPTPFIRVTLNGSREYTVQCFAPSAT